MYSDIVAIARCLSGLRLNVYSYCPRVLTAWAQQRMRSTQQGQSRHNNMHVITAAIVG